MNLRAIYVTGVVFSLLSCSCHPLTNKQFSKEDFSRYFFFTAIHRDKLIDGNSLNCGSFKYYQCQFVIDPYFSKENLYIIRIYTPNGCEYFDDHGIIGVEISNSIIRLYGKGKPIDNLEVYKEEINFLAAWKAHNIKIEDTIISKIAAHRYQQIFGIFD